MEGKEGVDMEVEGGAKSVNGKVINVDSCAPKTGGNGLGANKGAKKIGTHLDAVNLRVSHPSLAVGTKTGSGVAVSGHGDLKRRPKMQKKAHDRTLKEMTNKLDIGPISFKPSWGGPKLSTGVVSRDRIGLKSKGQEAKAHAKVN